MARLILGIALAVASLQAAPPQGPRQASKVSAVYLHYNYRCASCMRLETWSSAAIREGLKDSIRTGRLTWSTMNMETREGAELADKVGLMNKNVVLLEMQGDKLVRFKELRGTWTHLRDSSAFANYVKSETVAFLREAR